MQLTCLGAGAAFAWTKADRLEDMLFQTNFLLRPARAESRSPAEGDPTPADAPSGSNRASAGVSQPSVPKPQRLLVDCGATCALALKQVGLTLRDVDALFITHLHFDHIAGLEQTAFENRFGASRRRPLLYAHRAILDALWQVLQPSLGHVEGGHGLLEDYFEPRPIEAGQTFTFGSLVLRPIEVDHVRSDAPGGFRSYGLVVEETGPQGARVMLSGDTKADAARFVPWLDDRLAAVFHDCQFVGAPGGVHAHWTELKKYPADLRRCTYLIHYGPEYADFREEAARLSFRIAEQGRTYVFGE